MSLTKLLTDSDPWFARNSGKVVFAITLVLLATMLGMIPSPLSKVEALSIQHQRFEDRLTIQCVHDSKNHLEERECITGVLDPHIVRHK